MTPKVYKAGEVCELVQVQPYVLRSWEKEFPGIGVQKSPESPRLYRQSDLEQVQRIKQLVFGEGLTVAGARRRLEETSPASNGTSTSDVAEILDALSADARVRIAHVRAGLREIQALLSGTSASGNGSRGLRPFADARPAETPTAVGLKSGAGARAAVSARTGKGATDGGDDLQAGQREFALKPGVAKPVAKARPTAVRSKTVKRGAVATSPAARKKTQIGKRKRAHG